MPADIRPLFGNAATYKAMAAARHRDAVDCRKAGDEEGVRIAMDDVAKLDEQAALARKCQERAIPMGEPASITQAIDAIFGKAGRR